MRGRGILRCSKSDTSGLPFNTVDKKTTTEETTDMSDEVVSLGPRIRRVLDRSYPDHRAALDGRALDEIIDAAIQLDPPQFESMERKSATLNLGDWIALIGLAAQMGSLGLQVYDICRRGGVPADESKAAAVSAMAKSSAKANLDQQFGAGDKVVASVSIEIDEWYAGA